MRSVRNEDNIIILKGDIELANYKEQELEEYMDNPFIEALPHIFCEDEVAERFSVLPIIRNEDKIKPTNIRYHIIKRIKNFIQPLPIHFTIERRFSALIRRGYLARNPKDKTFLERLRILNELKDEEFDNTEFDDTELSRRMGHIRTTADSMSIIGISGMGKSTAIERILLMYPQIIKHEEYKGKYFSRTQIVWLKIDCPYDGSLSALSKSFFKAIDDLLGTRYLDKFGYLNRVTSTMLLHMTTLASMYGIGVLVIDEIQYLLNTKSNSEDEMLNFFVTLSNTVGIPTVLIGTSKAQQLFTDFKKGRRAVSEGAVMWDRMAKDSVEWQFFLETLWDFQGLKNMQSISEKINDVFYDECQGITAIAVTLFILAQERALAENKEEITIGNLRTTAKEDLYIIQPMIKALRNNDYFEIMKYEDISIDLDKIMLNHRKDLELTGKVQELFKERKNTIELKRRDTVENLVMDLTSIGIFDALDNIKLKKLIEKIVDKEPVDADYNAIKAIAIKQAMELNEKEKKDVNKGEKEIKQDGLIDIYDKARANNEHPYERLKARGYIKDPVEEFLKVN